MRKHGKIRTLHRAVPIFLAALSLISGSILADLCTERLEEQKQEIQKKMTEIFRNNGMEINQLFVKEKRGEARLEEVFPEILRKEKAINVRV